MAPVSVKEQENERNTDDCSSDAELLPEVVVSRPPQKENCENTYPVECVLIVNCSPTDVVPSESLKTSVLWGERKWEMPPIAGTAS